MLCEWTEVSIDFLPSPGESADLKNRSCLSIIDDVSAQRSPSRNFLPLKDLPRDFELGDTRSDSPPSLAAVNAGVQFSSEEVLRHRPEILVFAMAKPVPMQR